MPGTEGGFFVRGDVHRVADGEVEHRAGDVALGLGTNLEDLSTAVAAELAAAEVPGAVRTVADRLTEREAGTLRVGVLERGAEVVQVPRGAARLASGARPHVLGVEAAARRAGAVGGDHRPGVDALDHSADHVHGASDAVHQVARAVVASADLAKGELPTELGLERAASVFVVVAACARDDACVVATAATGRRLAARAGAASGQRAEVGGRSEIDTGVRHGGIRRLERIDAIAAAVHDGGVEGNTAVGVVVATAEGRDRSRAHQECRALQRVRRRDRRAKDGA